VLQRAVETLREATKSAAATLQHGSARGSAPDAAMVRNARIIGSKMSFLNRMLRLK
jgi:hypothetical protein